MAEASASRRWWLLGLVLLLAALNAMAWTGWRQHSARSGVDLDQFLSNMNGPAFELREEDFGLIAAGQVPVLVLDGESGLPLAGAAVWLSAQGWGKFQITCSGGTDNLADYPPGDAALTDERGIGWIPAPYEHCLVLASSRGAGGWMFVIPGDPLDALARCGQAKLVCSIFGGTALQVDAPSDASGQPLPVFVRGEASGARLPLRPLPGDGRMLVRWLDLVTLNWVDKEPDTPLRLVPGFCDESSIPLTPSLLRRGRATLAAPPTGQIQVRLQHFAGSLPSAHTAVFLEEAGKPWSNMRSLGSEEQMAGIAEAGTVLLRGVPLGRRWQIGYRLPGVLGRVSTIVAGPVSAGETVTVTMDPLLACRLLTVELHHADGDRLAEREIWVTLEGKNGEEGIRGVGTFLTDENGKLELPCATPASGEWQSVRLYFAGDAKDPACETKELTIPESGDLGEPESWLSEAFRAWGVVEDAEGGAIPRAKVGPALWQDTPVAPDGSFQFSDSSLEPGIPFDLVAAGPWHLPSRVLCKEPDKKVRIQLQKGSRVHGRLLLPSAARPYQVRVEPLGARGLNEDLESSRAEYDVFSRNGWFECGPFPAGTWDLRVRVGGIVVAEVPAAQLVAGELYRDRRLAAIDLRDHTQTYVRVRLKVGRGEPERSYVMVEMSDGSRLLAEAGNLLLPPAAVRVGVAAPGFKEEWMPVRAGDLTFSLEKE